jgi:hypothetical protein
MRQVSPARGGIAGKDGECFGVMQYWSTGWSVEKSKRQNFNLNTFLSLLYYSTTPLLPKPLA